MEEVLNMGTVPKLEQKVTKFWLYDGGNSRTLDEKEIEQRVADLNARVEQIYQLAHRVVRSFVEIGQALLEIQQAQSYMMVRNKREDFFSMEDFGYKVFGFSKSTTYNLINVARRFSSDGKILPQFTDYSYSKLVQFLPMNDGQIERFTPEVKVEEIRELRMGWEKYGYDGTKTWQEELHRVRECAAAELIGKEHKDRKAGLLSLLTGDNEPSAQPSATVSDNSETTAATSEPIAVLPLFAVPAKEKYAFKNDAERKDFISWENAAKWPIYVKIEKFNLHYHRMEFANGAVVFAAFGGEYSGFDHNTQKYDIYQKDKPYRLYLQTPEKPEFDMNGTSPSAIVEYMKTHREEI